MDNQDMKLFDDAYKNVLMGKYAIDCIIDKIDEPDLKDLMLKQKEYYLNAKNKLDNYARRITYEPKDLNAMLKTSSFLSINMKTIMNKSTSHIAEMLIEGTTMGITTLIKEIKQNPDSEVDLINISNEIVSNQEQFVESLKDFL